MLLVLPVSHRDFDGAKRLLEWCNVLQPSYAKHSALIVSSATLDADQAKELYLLAKKCEFHDVNVIRRKLEETSSWPKAPNLMFRDACLWVKTHQRGHWAWVEPDCTPLKEGWLDALEQEYVRGGRPFMGTTYNQPFRHVNGNAVYPQNVDQYNPYMANGPEIPFDTIRAELTLRNCHITELIHHEWGNIQTNTPWTFPDKSSLDRIRPNAVLFHRCKDQSLIDRLIESYQKVVRTNGKSFWTRFSRKPTKKDTIIVRRSGAIGDAIAATCVANKLIEKGYPVIFQCVPVIQKLLDCCPDITTKPALGKCHINLDNAYEQHAERKTKHYSEIFIEAANRHLAPDRIILDHLNSAPTIVIKEGHKRRFRTRWEKCPKPWIAIVPRSNSFNVRTVPDAIWKAAAENIQGTKFWLGTHAPPPEGIVDLKLREIYESAIAISCCDVCVTVDTGPMHIAAALGVPVIAIEQASKPELHLSDQRDFTVIHADVDCLGCQHTKCPINAANPPCQNISPYVIAMAVKRKLRGLESDDISCVIPIYRPTSERLNRCLTAVIPQVQEVVISCGDNGVIPSGLVQSPNVTVVKGGKSTVGYGRNVNFGVRHTYGQYVLNINDDLFLDYDAVGKLLKAIKSDDKCGMVGHLLWYPGRRSIQHGGVKRGFGDVGFGHLDHRKAIPTIRTLTEVESCTGASVLMRRSAFYQSGAFDERYFLYYEDSDLCMSMRKSGWKIFYTPEAQAIHDEHTSSKTIKSVSSHVRHSHAVFIEKWKDYFVNNVGTSLGNFKYLKQ